jgi:class 3 adenylate cyclase/tetratricopeptide (TPR) repeat protein
VTERRRERKVVTVLFADLVGFTSRAEQLDPEDVEEILRPYHERLRHELERHGGTVEKFIGDAVMAVFGAPVTHEDDPERAVRAALAICEWAAADGDLEVRIAVNTGEALVRLGANPAEGEGMVAGDVVNTASRLQNAAPVNGVLVGEVTYRATRDAIEYREAEAVTAKGRAEPVRVWEAVEARSRVGLEAAAPATPLVGRQRELDLLLGALARAREETSAQLVTLVGVPGIGKSRLVYELSQAIENQPDLISWRRGRSLPYGEGVTLWALGEIVKAEAGILETDAADATETKLRAAVSELADDAAEAQWLEANLRPLVGVVEEGAAHREDRFAAWRRFLEGLAERRPLVLVFEDVHWADDDLLDFVDYLVDWATGVPLIVVCTARPELLERRPTWGAGKPDALTISLSPLSDDETARLIGLLLERAVLPADAQAELLSRAGGNPLFAEQFARMLGEREAGAILAIPENVHAMIAARLDVLVPEEKALLQDAAVVGKVFWVGALAAVGGREHTGVEQLLHRLEHKEFARRQRRASVEGELEYAFHHVLVRDVAYAQIPRAARGEKHHAAAEWIESLGRPDDQAEMLAHHYLAALKYVRAAAGDTEELANRTLIAVKKAGDRAAALNAYHPAQAFYRSAIELAEQAGERAMLLEVHLRLGTMLFNVGELGASESELAVASALAGELGSHRDEAIAAYLLGYARFYLDKIDEAEELLLTAEDWLKRSDDTKDTYIRLQNLRSLARVALARGDPMLAESRLQEALLLALEGGGWLLIEVYRYLVEALILQERLDEARELTASAARNLPDDDLYARAAFLIAKGLVSAAAGERASTVASFETAISLLEQEHLITDLGDARLTFAGALLSLGEENGARIELERARAVFKRIHAEGFVAELERQLKHDRG